MPVDADIIENSKGLDIGLWVTPPPHLTQNAEDIWREYGRIKDAGMNMVWGFWDYGEMLGEVLDVCADLGIGYILPLPASRNGEGDLDEEIQKCLKAAKKHKDHPAVCGFNMIDEPSAAIFCRLAAIRGNMEGILPEKKYAIANLFPNYANANQLGAENYETYLGQYMATVKPKILSFDYYPLSLEAPSDNYRGFIANLLAVREASLKYDVPFWGFIQAIGYDGHREPAYGEMRWLCNMHILFGAKGYSYFLYSAIGPDGGAENFSTSALAWEGGTTPLYHMIKSINGEFAAFDRAFMQFRQDGFIPVNMKDSLLGAFAKELVKHTYGRLANIGASGAMLNGCFDFGGQKAIYLFNWDMCAPIEASLGFEGETAYALWGKNGMEAAGAGAKLGLALEAGEA